MRNQLPDALDESSDRNLADSISTLKVFSASSSQYMQWAENDEFALD
jgi:hypothetical protein